ncbi:tyrosine-type recombinase/integrase [Chryseobacterium potabilaquae]|uniref:Tyrosine recombinase XerD n=1 Tax=Chryseobacterium potabilaquae TaxID=2675057 RepID=A0A6N4XFH1_9FLAO|nr:phage integrase SAM-like domain-containing protein [Chryseobacterium potabilaquae]CAA7197407.1 Tyrosine recombinase XerD [Chryseobacterium potabilaquae]
MTFSYYLSKKKNSKKQIVISFTHQSKISHLKIPLFIEPKDWDDQMQRPKNIYTKKNKELNNKLNSIKVNLAKVLSNQKQEYTIIDLKAITSVIKKICSEEKQYYPKESLLAIMNEYLEAKKSFISLSTYRRYLVFLRLLEKFEGYIAKHIGMKDINTDFIHRFYTFGKAEQYTESTLKRTLEFVKTILNFAEQQGIDTEVRRLKIPKSKTIKKVITLSEKELNKIKQTQLPLELQSAKDWLIISCYTGQRISDFMQFNRELIMHINGKKCISFIQQKTGKEIVLPLHPEVTAVLKENGNTFPKPMEYSIYNKQIKKIAQLAQINEWIKTRKRIGFRSKEVKIEKWENISSHIGRRSFASNFYGKIPTQLLMQATGHSTEKIFLSYVNAHNNEGITMLGKYFEKIHSKRKFKIM